MLIAGALTVGCFPIAKPKETPPIAPVLPLLMAALYIAGPFLAIVLAATIALGLSVGAHKAKALRACRSSRRRVGACVTMYALAVGVPALAYELALRAQLFDRVSVAGLVALSCTSFAAFVIASAIATDLDAAASGERRDIVWHRNHRHALLVATLASPLGFAVAVATGHNIVLGASLLALALLATRRGYQLDASRREIAKRGVDLLGRMMQEAHPYTQGHVERVSQWTVKIARRMQIGAASMAIIEDAAVLHDIGKVAVDNQLLNKAGALTDREWRTIKQHPVTGQQIVSTLPSFERASMWINHHHERFDGQGYPSGLAGSAIPIEARIIAVVDSFDAMVGGPDVGDQRPYRRTMTYAAACDELRRCAGTQFDPDVVRTFLAILEDEGHITSLTVDRRAQEVLL
jgi:HD-GYP domain-containing protein (c-di-GMP phosphodiesterase class II)